MRYVSRVRASSRLYTHRRSRRDLRRQPSSMTRRWCLTRDRQALSHGSLRISTVNSRGPCACGWLSSNRKILFPCALQAVTPQYAQDYVTRFGFDAKYHPPYLTMALGAGNVTPMQMVTGYGVFANGGFRVPPYFISRVEDIKGNIVVDARPERAGENAERAIDARNAFIMT